MKKIKITGKRNVDSFKEKNTRTRNTKFNDKLLDKNKHQNFINMLFLNEKFEDDHVLKRELINKINGYKSQDKKKKILNETTVINYEELIEKLVISKLRCYYCKGDCLLVYNKVLEKKQWTLDRLNNDLGHSNDNVVISCLECNLKRRTMNENDFKFIKQMKIIKKDNNE